MFVPVGWEGVAGGGEMSGGNIKLSEVWMLGLSLREAFFCPAARMSSAPRENGVPKESSIWEPWSECLL